MMGAVLFSSLPENVLGQCLDCEVTCGTAADAPGACSFAQGSGASATGDASVSMGAGTNATDELTFAIGGGCESTGYWSCSFGQRALAYGDHSLCVGQSIRALSTASYNYIFGTGSGIAQLENNENYSIMMGMNSNVSTVFIGNSGGTSNSYGNVGIGNITSPASLLHVRDQVRLGLTSGANGSLVFNNSAGNTITFNTPSSMSNQSYVLPTAIGTNGDILGLGTSGQLQWVAGSTGAAGWLLAGNTDADASSKLGATTTGVPLRIFAGNSTTERMFIHGTSGNVGIGTSSPADLLHLYTAGNTSLRVQYGSSSSGYLRFWSPSALTGYLGMDNSNVFRIFNQVAEGDVRVGIVKIGDSSSSDAMRVIGSSGNVGIGTNSSGSRLSVVQSKSNGAGSTPVAQERVARFAVADASSDWLDLLNRTAVDNEFAPMMQTVSTQSAEPALTIDAQTGATNDTGSVPMMEFSVRISNNTDVGTRPLFEWNNRTSSKMLMKADGNLGIGTAGPQGRLHVNGTVFVNYASVPAGSTLTDEDLGINPSNGQVVNLSTSSIHFKENVENIEFDKEAFLNLRPVDYNWKEFYGGHSDVGLIAQEVAETFPPLASWSHRYTHLNNGDLLRDSTGIPVMDTSQLEVSGVRYHKLPVYLLAIAKDQQNEIAELQQRLQELTERLDGCCTEVGAMHRLSREDPQQVAKSESFDEFVLLQNDPNPFRDYTDIRYDHDGCTSCEIIISDMSGRIIKRIKTSGSKGTVRVYSSEIGSGLFLYSLVKDGQAVRSERMVSSNR